MRFHILLKLLSAHGSILIQLYEKTIINKKTPVFIRYFGVFKSKELIKLFSMQFINVAWTRIQVIVNQIHFLLYHM